jgi:hypothetical protein
MEIIERYTNPSKHVLEPYGTIVKNDNEYFIQVSKEEDTANWITLGELFLEYHKSNLSDDFISKCLETYQGKNVCSDLNMKV